MATIPASVVAVHDLREYKTADVAGYGSGDPTGLAYIPGLDTLLIADSEHDESPYDSPTNLFSVRLDGSLVGSHGLTGFTSEPTGLAYNPLNGLLYIADDDIDEVFWADPANPSVSLGQFDTARFGYTDTEDLKVDPATGHLFVLDGIPRKLGEFTDKGALVSSMNLPSVIPQAEGLAYDPTRDVFFVSSTASAKIWQMSRSGVILATIDVLQNASYRNPITGGAPALEGLELAPSSNPNDGNTLSLFAVDWGLDQQNDGRLFEISLGPGWLVGGLGDDRLEGSTSDDVFSGYAGDDELLGRGGNDQLDGGIGNDTLDGGDGADSLSGGDGTDQLLGDMGSDSLLGGGGDDWIDGGTGFDTVSFSGRRSDYRATTNTLGQLVLTDTRAGGDGVDTIAHVEAFKFAGATLSLAEVLNFTRIDLTGGVVHENAPAGAVVGTFSLQNPDASSSHSYVLLENAGGRFSLSGNNLVVAEGASLDHEAAAAHQVTIRVTGAGGQNLDQTFMIQVADVSESPKDILLSASRIGENSLSGAVVGTLSTLDPDVSSGFTYTLLNDAGGRFALSGSNVVVANGSLLDFEQAQSHSVTIRATDQGGLARDEVFTLLVLDISPETAVGTASNEMLVGGAGPDKLFGAGGADSLVGKAGRDKLNGGIGNDKLRGDLGVDRLTGGPGKDRFIFDDRETGGSERTADYITDFRGKLGDKLDVRLIDANSRTRPDGKFTFIGAEDAFSGVGQVRYEKVGKATYVYLNTDSDAAAEAVIRLKGAMDLEKEWFVL